MRDPAADQTIFPLPSEREESPRPSDSKNQRREWQRFTITKVDRQADVLRNARGKRHLNPAMFDPVFVGADSANVDGMRESPPKPRL